MGDPGKLLLLEGVVDVMKKEDLLGQVRRSGDRLLSGIKQLQNEFPALLSRARGRGTFLAVTCSNGKLRDDLVGRLRAKGWYNLFTCWEFNCFQYKHYLHVTFYWLNLGIQSGGCGDDSIRLRPALIFQEHHADIFLDRFRQVLAETK